MSTIISISDGQKAELKTIFEDFEQKAKRAGYSAAAAAFLTIGASIVITCGCLCLMLPGVNVISHVILPAVVPGSFAILASLPFIFFAVKYTGERNEVRDQMINKMLVHLESYGIPDIKAENKEKAEKQRVKFILHNFLHWIKDPNNPNKLLKNKSWAVEYQSKILEELKERIGKKKEKRNPRQEKIATAIDAATRKVTSRK